MAGIDRDSVARRLAAGTALAMLGLAAALPPENQPLTLLALALLGCAGAALTRSLPGPQQLTPWLLLWVWAALSACWSPSLHASLAGLVVAGLALLGLRLGLELSPSRWPLAALVAALVLWHAGRALWQRAFGFERLLGSLPEDLPWGELAVQRLSGGRAFSSFALPGHLAVFLAASLGLLALWSTTLPRRPRLACWLTMALGLAGYLASLSYGGLAALAAASLWLAVLTRLRPSRRALLAGLTLLLVVVAVLALARGADLLTTGPENPLSARLGNWQRALQAVTAHPAAGVGLGGYPVVHAELLQPGDVATRHAHNGYLELLAELGPPGLALLLWGLVALHRRALELLATEQAHTRRRRLGVLLAADTLWLHAAIDVDLAMPGLLIPAAVLLAASAGGGRDAPQAGWRWLSWALPALLFAATLAGVQGRLALEASLASAQSDEALVWSERGLRWDPLSVRLAVRRAELLEQRGDADAALEQLECALELEPRAAWLRGRKAELHLRRAEPLLAHWELVEAASLYPAGPYAERARLLRERLEETLIWQTPLASPPASPAPGDSP